MSLSTVDKTTSKDITTDKVDLSKYKHDKDYVPTEYGDAKDLSPTSYLGAYHFEKLRWQDIIYIGQHTYSDGAGVSELIERSGNEYTCAVGMELQHRRFSKQQIFNVLRQDPSLCELGDEFHSYFLNSDDVDMWDQLAERVRNIESYITRHLSVLRILAKNHIEPNPIDEWQDALS